MIDSSLQVALTGVRGGIMAGTMILMMMMIMVSMVFMVVMMTPSHQETMRRAASMIVVIVDTAHARSLLFKLFKFLLS